MIGGRDTKCAVVGVTRTGLRNPVLLSIGLILWELWSVLLHKMLLYHLNMTGCVAWLSLSRTTIFLSIDIVQKCVF